jgi:hypothetical protein
VVTVNGAVALVSWPFALYEVFAKSPQIPELRDRVELLRTRLLGSVALDLADKLMPFWPRSSSRIILQPNYEADQPPSLSDEAIDEMKACLESQEVVLGRAISLRRMCPRMLRLNHLCYWLIFATAAEAMVALVVWFFDRSMPRGLAFALLAVPILSAGFALVTAALRQSVIHAIQRAIVSGEGK